MAGDSVIGKGPAEPSSNDNGGPDRQSADAAGGRAQREALKALEQGHGAGVVDAFAAGATDAMRSVMQGAFAEKPGENITQELKNISRDLKNPSAMDQQKLTETITKAITDAIPQLVKAVTAAVKDNPQAAASLAQLFTKTAGDITKGMDFVQNPGAINEAISKMMPGIRESIKGLPEELKASLGTAFIELGEKAVGATKGYMQDLALRIDDVVKKMQAAQKLADEEQIKRLSSRVNV